MKRALVVGGNSGIGLAVVLKLLDEKYEHVYIVGKDEPILSDIPMGYTQMYNERVSFFRINLVSEQYDVFDEINGIDTLVITAGFGRVAPFEDLTEIEITNLIKCNELGAMRIVKKYYDKINSQNDFNCEIMGSIAGHVASPLFSVYGASKMGLCGFIENINAELNATGCKNRILDVSPGSIGGTKFHGGENNMEEIMGLAEEIVKRMRNKETLYIPEYDEVFKGVIERYKQEPEKYALESYEYKIKNGRIATKPQVTVGYLSGTFDLFHIGHLNLLKRAKEQCDYLVVGVHESGAWKGKETFIPFEERAEIVRNVKYVDKVIKSFPEDSDAHDVIKYDKLFVGSDYKNSERFMRYEEILKKKGVEIVYFPYTKGTSSTQLREKINKNKDN